MKLPSIYLISSIQFSISGTDFWLFFFHGKVEFQCFLPLQSFFFFFPLMGRGHCLCFLSLGENLGASHLCDVTCWVPGIPLPNNILLPMISEIPSIIKAAFLWSLKATGFLSPCLKGTCSWAR